MTDLFFVFLVLGDLVFFDLVVLVDTYGYKEEIGPINGLLLIKSRFATWHL